MEVPPQAAQAIPHPQQRLVAVGTMIRFRANNDLWSYATIMDMKKKSIEQYPHWYNIRGIVRGKFVNRSIELLPEDRGPLWNTVDQDI